LIYGPVSWTLKRRRVTPGCRSCAWDIQSQLNNPIPPATLYLPTIVELLRRAGIRNMLLSKQKDSWFKAAIVLEHGQGCPHSTGQLVPYYRSLARSTSSTINVRLVPGTTLFSVPFSLCLSTGGPRMEKEKGRGAGVQRGLCARMCVWATEYACWTEQIDTMAEDRSLALPDQVKRTVGRRLVGFLSSLSLHVRKIFFFFF
jgi:hypothetical protein